MTNAEAVKVLLDVQKRGRAFTRYTAIEQDDAMQLALEALGGGNGCPDCGAVCAWCGAGGAKRVEVTG